MFAGHYKENAPFASINLIDRDLPMCLSVDIKYCSDMNPVFQKAGIIKIPVLKYPGI